MRYGSVSSGIEAASAAWHPLGWEAEFFAEIEPFPNAVLAYRWPKVKNFGDMTKFKEWKHGSIDLLVGGTPCQSFSVAGLRKGLADPRGNLALTFLAILNKSRPRWVVWENVPGILSSWSNAETHHYGRYWQTNDFDTFTCGLRELGYGLAWRILDAQYFGVPQRRRRVFVVGYLGDWRRAAAVLFERESLSGNPPPRRAAGKGSAGSIAKSLRGRGNASHREDRDTYIPEISPALKSRDYKGPSSDGDGDGSPLIVHALRADGFDASEDGTGRGTPIILDMRGNGDGNISPTLSRSAVGDRPNDFAPMIFSSKDHGADASNISPTLRSGGHDKSHANAGIPPAIAFDPGVLAREGGHHYENVAGTLRKDHGDNQMSVSHGSSVRRLTPRECERLQGFPDDWTLVPYRGKPASDGPRYKAIGNSMAVPVMAWIGKRIAMVDKLK